MKKSTKYLIARLVIVALCMVLGFGLGWISKETEVVEVNITRPIVRVNQPIEEVEPTANYTEMKVIATAYCPCNKCCGKSDGITAIGVKAKEGRTIAADPKVFPYGTKILIDGNVYTVEDCGSAIKNNKVDIFFESHEKALDFGMQYLTAYVKVE